MILIEYDDGKPDNDKDGKPIKYPEDKPKYVTRKERKWGFYLLRNGKEFRIPIGYMRVGEMETFRQMLEKAYEG